MTAIAYRDGVLAADSSCFQGPIFVGKSRKIWRLADGRLFAASGRLADCEACRQWIEGGCDPAQRPSPIERESFAALVVGPRPGDVVKVEWDFRPFQAPEQEFFALGCHYEFLLGAMEQSKGPQAKKTKPAPARGQAPAGGNGRNGNGGRAAGTTQRLVRELGRRLDERMAPRR